MATPTDPYALLHFNMIHAHQTYKRGYDIILSHLKNPPLYDLQNFLGYCEAWAVSIEVHHDSEEKVVFPFLNQKMDFSGEIEQHKAIHDTLDKILATIHDARTDPSKFDATKMNALMLEFKDPLFSHLDEEVEHVHASKLKEANFAEKDVLAMIAGLEKHAKGTGDPFMIVPFMRSHTSPEHKDVWPSMPWILRKVVIPYVLAKRYSGYWKYSPYAMS
ncbi:hypothetical protein BDZ94DRAFT_1151020 [Collybia nuda]|uniref:Hemerythrin-like domain-containing protein n=1 Tax=Collybia nuda TaxID=64659 RepID=A0A9P5YIK6_9AGAR|nr:hypothetical protein BDZ94DRAFT_1151020 [Collybia nuda]